MSKLVKNLPYRFRASVNAVQFSENTVLIGSNRRNFVELIISDEIIASAIQMFADGATLEAISANFSENEELMDEFLSIVRVLLERDLIELKETKIQGSDLRRFDRQILFFMDVMNLDRDKAISIQRKIENTRVGVLGVGGVGSYIARTLSSMGFGQINILDHDNVEESNISRQIFYDYRDIGRKKIEVVAEKIKFISPNTRVVGFDLEVRSISDVQGIAEESDLLLCAIDSPKPKIYDIVSRIPFEYNIPAVYGGSVSDNVSVGPTVVKGKSRCLKCVRGIGQNVESYSNLGFMESIRATHTTTLIDPINALAASFMSLEAVKLVTECLAPMFNSSFLLDLETYSKSHYEPLASGSACPVCNTK
jgi:molybdopterin/thiamine biosynthesis adenylyltransferase